MSADYSDSFTIRLDKRWTLEDFSNFPAVFQQAYFFWNSLEIGEETFAFERVSYAFTGFPWQGGYSSVNFFNQLKYAVPASERPNIVSIYYGSPGALVLSLCTPVALMLSGVVRSVAKTIDQCNTVYGNIYRGMQERKLLRLRTEVNIQKLEREKLKFIKQSVRQLEKILEIRAGQIDERTGHPYISLKILLAVYRRTKELAGYERRGTASFPLPSEAQRIASVSSAKKHPKSTKKHRKGTKKHRKVREPPSK